MAYKLTHPDSDLEIEVNQADLQNYLSQGWETKPSANPPPATATGKE